MKKKINIMPIIDILYWSLIIISAFIDTKNLTKEYLGIKFWNLTLEQFITVIINNFPFFVLFCIINMIYMFYITVIYLGIKIANRKYKKEKMENVDFKNDSYYKEILPKYSPAVLSYVDDFKIEQKDIVATLLMLELKRKIQIQENEIVLLDEKIDKLDGNEIFILNSVKNKTLKDINILEFSKIVKEDALKQRLVQEKNTKEEMIKKLIILIVFFAFMYPAVMVIISVLIVITINTDISILLVSGLIMGFGFIPIGFGTIISTIISYKTLNKLDPYIRNNEGKKINKKLEGLRKYLIDYSKIDEKTKDHLILLEDYLIYSVILGVNEKIVEEVNDKIIKNQL